MSTFADKLNIVAENIQKVYEAGKAAGGGGGSYEQGYEQGKNTITTRARTLQFADLNFGVQVITLNLDNITTFNQMFYKALGDTSEITINCPNLVTSMSAFFDGDTADKKLKKITLNVDTQKTTNFNAFVWNRQGLEIIGGTPLNFISTTNIGSAFFGCYSLKEMRIVANTIKVAFNVANSPDLSDETIQSIIDGLADLTGSTAQTLTFHSTVGAKLTDTQKATITAKNWTLVY